jgi:protein TonB
VPAARTPSAVLPLLVVASLALLAIVGAIAVAGVIIYTDRGGFSRSSEEDPGPVGPGPASDAQPAAEQPEPAADAAPAAPPIDQPDAQPAPAVERPDERASDVERPQRADGDRGTAAGRRERRPGTVGSTLGEAPPAAPSPPPPMLRAGGQIRQPAKIRDVRPVYPAIAQQARVQGTVILEATISPQGKVEDIRVLRSIPLLDDAAREAVRQWEYEPTYLNGQPVAVIVTVTVNFTLSRD